MTTDRAIAVLSDILRRQTLSLAEGTAAEDALNLLAEAVKQPDSPASPAPEGTPAPSAS